MRSPFTSSLTAKPDQLLHSFDHSSTSATFADQLPQRSVHVPKTLHLPCSSAFPPIKFRPVRARLTPFKTSRHLVLLVLVSDIHSGPDSLRLCPTGCRPLYPPSQLVSGAGQAVRLHPTSTVQYFSYQVLFPRKFPLRAGPAGLPGFIPRSSRRHAGPAGLPSFKFIRLLNMLKFAMLIILKYKSSVPAGV